MYVGGNRRWVPLILSYVYLTTLLCDSGSWKTWTGLWTGLDSGLDSGLDFGLSGFCSDII